MRFFYNKTATVERLTDEATATKEAYTTNGTIDCSLIPISAEDAFLDSGDPGKTYSLYTEYESDLKETDRVTIDSIKYTVKGIRKMDMLSSSHLHAIVVELNS